MSNHTPSSLHSIRVLAALTAAAGCQWEIEPAATEQGLATVLDASAECAEEPRWDSAYQCGEPFSARIWGECNDCGDLGCTQPNPESYECVCYGRREQCVELGADAGNPTTLCRGVPARCACGDGEGPVYTCGCEGGGDDCGCMVPERFTLDYEFECE
jgi:hypothetical protein